MTHTNTTPLKKNVTFDVFTDGTLWDEQILNGKPTVIVNSTLSEAAQQNIILLTCCGVTAEYSPIGVADGHVVNE